MKTSSSLENKVLSVLYEWKAGAVSDNDMLRILKQELGVADPSYRSFIHRQAKRNELIVESWQTGFSMVFLATKFGISRQRIHKILKHNNAMRR